MLLPLFAAVTLTSLSGGTGLLGDSVLTEGPTAEVPPPPPLAPSALNLTFDPGTWMLTWLCSREITVTSCSVTVTLHGRPRRQRKQNPLGCRCRFRPLTLHLGVTLEVNATAGNVTMSEKLDYAVPGPPGSEAVNISCEIQDAATMTCSWGVGPAAPPDARYFLVLRNATGHELPGCLDGPAPSGCRIHDLTGFPRLLHVTVAGSSRLGALRAYDFILNTKAIERLSPPRDVTGRCNASHCTVSWAPPRTWATMGFADFRYELNLRSADTDAEDMVTFSSRPENRFVFLSPEPRAGHVVRVRVGDVRSERWSAWSPRVEFGATSPAVPHLPVYLTMMAATLICALGLVFAWRRFSGCRLLPRIPEIRDKVRDNTFINPQTLRKDLLQPAEKAL